MSTLVLVRHGQASFLSEDYDRLSDLGRRQARLLADYWIRRRERFDAAFSGPRERQIGTAKAVEAAHMERGAPFPSIRVIEDWDEYAGEAVVRELLPRLAGERPELAGLLDPTAHAGDPERIRRQFQKAFEVVMKEWIRGEHRTEGIESWGEFGARIARGLASTTSSEVGRRRVVVFTSGGAIAAVLQKVLGTSDEVALELSWMVKNGAFTEVLYTRDRMTLAGFNATPHLDDPGVVTYR